MNEWLHVSLLQISFQDWKPSEGRASLACASMKKLNHGCHFLYQHIKRRWKLLDLYEVYDLDVCPLSISITNNPGKNPPLVVDTICREGAGIMHVENKQREGSMSKSNCSAFLSRAARHTGGGCVRWKTLLGGMKDWMSYPLWTQNTWGRQRLR